jgi:hypothetical protein
MRIFTLSVILILSLGQAFAVTINPNNVHSMTTVNYTIIHTNDGKSHLLSPKVQTTTTLKNIKGDLHPKAKQAHDAALTLFSFKKAFKKAKHKVHKAGNSAINFGKGVVQSGVKVVSNKEFQQGVTQYLGTAASMGGKLATRVGVPAAVGVMASVATAEPAPAILAIPKVLMGAGQTLVEELPNVYDSGYKMGHGGAEALMNKK